MDVLGIDGYKVIKNFISQEQCEFFQNYCKISHQLNFDKFDPTTDSFPTGSRVVQPNWIQLWPGEFRRSRSSKEVGIRAP